MFTFILPLLTLALDPLSHQREQMEEKVQKLSALFAIAGQPLYAFPVGRADEMYVADWDYQYVFDPKRPKERPQHIELLRSLALPQSLVVEKWSLKNGKPRCLWWASFIISSPHSPIVSLEGTLLRSLSFGKTVTFHDEWQKALVLNLEKGANTPLALYDYNWKIGVVNAWMVNPEGKSITSFEGFDVIRYLKGHPGESRPKGGMFLPTSTHFPITPEERKVKARH